MGVSRCSRRSAGLCRNSSIRSLAAMSVRACSDVSLALTFNPGGPAVYHFQKIQEKWPSFWLVGASQEMACQRCLTRALLPTVLFFIGIAESVRIADGWNNPRAKVEVRAFGGSMVWSVHS